MKTNMNVQAAPFVRFISDDQIYQIHLASLEVLERVGVTVQEDEGLSLLKEAGAYVNGRRVRIPAHLVEEALRTAPPRTVLCDRNGNRKMYLEKNEIYFGTGSDLPFTIDPYTGERRSSTKKDVATASRFVDALPNIDFMMSFGIATDTPEVTSDLHQFEAMVTSTIKPMIITAHHGPGLLDQIEMAAIIRGGYEALRERPLFCCYDEPVSPLVHTIEGTQKLLTCSEYGIPVNYTAGIMAGAAAPATRAGAIIQANAECLSGLVMHQLKRKGSPFVYGGAVCVMDMGSSNAGYAAAEFHLSNMIVTQLGQYYKLPIFSTAGCSDSPIFDQQAADEASYTLLLAGMSGANLIHDVGYLESGLTACLDSLMYCDEIIDRVRYLLRGIQITDEKMALDVIEQVGPAGNFLSHPHTCKHYREEFWFPKYGNRERYEGWAEGGSTTLCERVHRQVLKVLAEHEPQQLDPGATEAIAAVIRKAEERYGVSR